jgi:hypothetical protein
MQGDVQGARRAQAVTLVLLAVLVPLPLAVLLGSLMRPTPRDGRAAIPMLPLDHARGLPTYGRDCMRPDDCDPSLGCLELNGRWGRGLCLNTECEADGQCEPGERCRTLRTLGGGPPLRRCDLDSGERAEGELCAVSLSFERGRCRTGLRCNQGWCGRPCRLGEASTCSEGFLCQQGLDGPSCVPTCERHGCPEGLQCVREAGGISVCAHLRGSDCPDGSCPAGSRCTFTNRRLLAKGLRLRLECIAPCGEGLPACPSGQTCIADRCWRTCDPQGPTACHPEEQCVYRVDLGISMCTVLPWGSVSPP